MAARKREAKEREQREWEEAEAKKKYERLAGAKITMADLDAAGQQDGMVIVSEVIYQDMRIFLCFASIALRVRSMTCCMHVSMDGLDASGDGVGGGIVSCVVVFWLLQTCTVVLCVCVHIVYHQEAVGAGCFTYPVAVVVHAHSLQACSLSSIRYFVQRIFGVIVSVCVLNPLVFCGFRGGGTVFFFPSH